MVKRFMARRLRQLRHRFGEDTVPPQCHTGKPMTAERFSLPRTFADLEVQRIQKDRCVRIPGATVGVAAPRLADPISI
jgi:hypothetical protein